MASVLAYDCFPCSCALVDLEPEREAVDAVMRRERAADLHVLGGVTAGLLEPPEREDDRRGRLVDLGQMVEIVDPRPQLEPLFNPCGGVRIAEVVEHAPGAAAERVRLQLDVAEPRCEVFRLGRRRLSPAQIDRPSRPARRGPARAQGCRVERARAPGRSSRRPGPLRPLRPHAGANRVWKASRLYTSACSSAERPPPSSELSIAVQKASPSKRSAWASPIRRQSKARSRSLSAQARAPVSNTSTSTIS